MGKGNESFGMELEITRLTCKIYRKFTRVRGGCNAPCVCRGERNGYSIRIGENIECSVSETWIEKVLMVLVGTELRYETFYVAHHILRYVHMYYTRGTNAMTEDEMKIPVSRLDDTECIGLARFRDCESASVNKDE